MSITDFFKSLNAPLKNPRWSWGALSEDERKVYLRVWHHEIEDENGTRYVPLIRGDKRKLGYRERLRHAQLIEEGVEAYCIVCKAADPRASPKRIRSIDKQPVRATLVRRDGNAYLQLSDTM